MKVLTVSKTNFAEEIEKSDVPVIVDFWAPWCQPCRAMAPVVEELAAQFEGKVKVCKVNIDEEPALTSQYRVMTIPTIVLIENNQVTGQAVGAMRKEALLDRLNIAGHV